jgi:glycosyltransferase involved in cell wall biosynthesis
VASWHLITGEYPPQAGGVADYTYRMAGTLVAAGGAGVQVWCPPADAPTPEQPGVTVNRVAGGWSLADLVRLDAALEATPPPRRLFVQYVPQSFGWKGMNLGFSRWLAGRSRRGDSVWTMVHEAYVVFRPRHDPPRRWLLSAIQKIMMRMILGASERVYISIPSWESMLRRVEPSRGAPQSMNWLPVPSNILVVDDPHAVEELRCRVAPGHGLILGHFGTFGAAYRSDLLSLLPPLLTADASRVALLLGRGGPAFAAQLQAAHPTLAGRIIAPGGLDPEPLSMHLQACDLMIQPYDEGICTRRTTAMACLLHGRAIVSTQGCVTEPELWDGLGTSITPVGDHDAFLAAAEALLADPAARASLGAAAASLYRQRFAVELTVATLLADAKAIEQTTTPPSHTVLPAVAP